MHFNYGSVVKDTQWTHNFKLPVKLHIVSAIWAAHITVNVGGVKGDNRILVV